MRTFTLTTCLLLALTFSGLAQEVVSKPPLSLTEAALLAENALKEKNMGNGYYIRSVKLVRSVSADDKHYMFYQADYGANNEFGLESAFTYGTDKFIEISMTKAVRFTEKEWTRPIRERSK